MWPFSKKVSRAALEGHKTVTIHGHKFVIRKVNPLLDFTDESMPQIFSAYITRRKEAEPRGGSLARIKRDVAVMLEAGLVEPKLVKDPKEGITVLDLMRDEETCSKLYVEIVAHTLNRFRGLKGVFFSQQTRRALLIALQSAMVADPVTSSSETAQV